MANPTKLQRLQAEARVTTLGLNEATAKLLRWATLIDPDSLMSPELLRELARQLAHQSGRLDMAIELSKPKA